MRVVCVLFFFVKGLNVAIIIFSMDGMVCLLPQSHLQTNLAINSKFHYVQRKPNEEGGRLSENLVFETMKMPNQSVRDAM